MYVYNNRHFLSLFSSFLRKEPQKMEKLVWIGWTIWFNLAGSRASGIFGIFGIFGLDFASFLSTYVCICTIYCMYVHVHSTILTLQDYGPSSSFAHRPTMSFLLTLHTYLLPSFQTKPSQLCINFPIRREKKAHGSTTLGHAYQYVLQQSIK